MDDMKDKWVCMVCSHSCNCPSCISSHNDDIETLRKYVEHFDGVGRGLKSTVDRYNLAVQTWDNRIMPRVKQFETLGANKGDEIKDLNPVDSSVREIIKKE